MRNLLLFVFLLSTCFLSAQYEKGNWYLEGNSSLGNTSPESPNSNGAGGIGGGFFAANRLLVGARVENLTDYFVGGNSRLTSYGRYYFPLQGKRLSYFAEVGATYNFDAFDDFDFHAAVGLEYELAPGVMLNAALSHQIGVRDRTALDISMNIILGKKYRPENGHNFLNRKGTLLLNGDVANLSVSSFRDDKLSIFGDARISVGYFLTNRLYVEAGLAFYASSLRLGSEAFPQDFTSRSIAAEVSARYFFLPGKRFQPYVGAGVGHDYTHQKQDRLSSTTIRETTFSRTDNFVNLQTGFLHHLNERVALDFNIRLNRDIGRFENNFISAGFGLKVRLDKQ